jgi:hypothetical protein
MRSHPRRGGTSSDYQMRRLRPALSNVDGQQTPAARASSLFNRCDPVLISSDEK